jgi:hypothetical protein
VRRIVLTVSLSLALVISFAGMASAGQGNGHAYGQRIKACTGLSYGQLKKAAKTGGTLRADITWPTDWSKPSMGAKLMWEHLETQAACIALVAPVTPAP